MRFLLDECIRESVREALVASGGKVLRFRDVGMAGSSDGVVLSTAERLNCVLVTEDKGFGRRFVLALTASTASVILLRYPRGALSSTVATMMNALGAVRNDAPFFLVAKPGVWRIRYKGSVSPKRQES